MHMILFKKKIYYIIYLLNCFAFEVERDQIMFNEIHLTEEENKKITLQSYQVRFWMSTTSYMVFK